jgi:hypothetical protein
VGAAPACFADHPRGSRRGLLIINIISIITVILLALTSSIMLLSQRWRWSMIALAVQYLAVFWLVGLVWSVSMSAVKLVVGWMVTAMIGASQLSDDYVENKFPDLPGLLIRLLSIAMVAMLVISIGPSLVNVFQTGMVLIWGGLILVGMGFLQLGLSTRVSRIILGLFTFLSGFEILYASLESSVLVTGLLALINLALAMVGVYLLEAPSIEAKA